ncbi:MAG: hypothetical protein HUJ52_01885 [Malacoplasma sp.]|nr:hypothetical protein [Malacoplasma sp.]
MTKFFQVRTKPWKTTLLVLFAFILFLLIWLLIGDINLLKQDYIIPIDGVVWKGIITNDNIGYLSTRYLQYSGYASSADFQSALSAFVDKNAQIQNVSGNLFFNPITLAWLFGGLGLTILLPIILRLCKQTNWDVLPFTIAMSLAGFIFIISGLIPQTIFKDGKIIWLWVIRIIIMFATFAVFFFSINAIVGVVIAHSKYGAQYINQLKADKLADDQAKKESKELVDMYIKNREKESITYIDVEEGKKKN